MIEYEAIPLDPEGERWTGRFRIGNGQHRVCGHRHLSADRADQCAGILARKVARDQLFGR